MKFNSDFKNTNNFDFQIVSFHNDFEMIKNLLQHSKT